MWAFNQAEYFYTGRKRAIRMIVVHDMEAPQGHLTAENVAAFFHAGKTKASAHLCVDKDSIVQCVKIADTAWHAPNANADGIGIEHAGYARQTRAQWLSEDAMLNLSAGAAAELCNRLWIPPAHLTDAQIRDGKSRGFCGHADVTRAFATAGGHTDPGAGFPWDTYLAKVKWFLPNAKSQHAS